MFDALLIITCNMPAWMSVMGRVGALSSARALLSTQACRGGSNGIDLPTVQYRYSTVLSRVCPGSPRCLFTGTVLYCTGKNTVPVLYRYSSPAGTVRVCLECYRVRYRYRRVPTPFVVNVSVSDSKRGYGER